LFFILRRSYGSLLRVELYYVRYRGSGSSKVKDKLKLGRVACDSLIEVVFLSLVVGTFLHQVFQAGLLDLALVSFLANLVNQIEFLLDDVLLWFRDLCEVGLT
jgi:hypothetical protein